MRQSHAISRSSWSVSRSLSATAPSRTTTTARCIWTIQATTKFHERHLTFGVVRRVPPPAMTMFSSSSAQQPVTDSYSSLYRELMSISLSSSRNFSIADSGSGDDGDDDNKSDNNNTDDNSNDLEEDPHNLNGSSISSSTSSDETMTTSTTTTPSANNQWLRPSEVVRELDKHIVGQQDAKRTIANAFRMRWRRRQLPSDLKKEVKPRNVLLIGPTGCGKTEIARKMADLCKAPFIKVEATKYTEVGYHGRDVDQIIRDLVENAIHLVRKEKTEEFREQAKHMVEESILDVLVGETTSTTTTGTKKGTRTSKRRTARRTEDDEEEGEDLDVVRAEDEDNYQDDDIKKTTNKEDSTDGGPKDSPSERTRDGFRDLLRGGALDNHTIIINIPRSESGGAPGDRLFGRVISDSSLSTLLDVFVKVADRRGGGNDKSSSSSSSSSSSTTEKRRVTVAEARKLLLQAQVDEMLESIDLKKEAIAAVEERGIAFIDEIDKIVMPREAYRNTDASAEGVQRDLLPVVEGTTIDTKYGNINTDHILFIASGAFHSVKPSDMLPELQGRFPIRVELKGLGENDLYRILTEPVANLVLQQVELMKTEGVRLEFTEDGIREIARLAALANREMENIGARRLHTVMERIVDQVSFEAPDLDDGTHITVDKTFVSDRLQDMVVKSDQSKYIL